MLTGIQHRLVAEDFSHYANDWVQVLFIAKRIHIQCILRLFQLVAVEQLINCKSQSLAIKGTSLLSFGEYRPITEHIVINMCQ